MPHGRETLLSLGSATTLSQGGRRPFHGSWRTFQLGNVSRKFSLGQRLYEYRVFPTLPGAG